MVKYGKHRHLDIAYIECLGDGFPMIFVSFIIFRQYFNSDSNGLFECFGMVDLLETRYFHIVFNYQPPTHLLELPVNLLKILMLHDVAWDFTVPEQVITSHFKIHAQKKDTDFLDVPL